MSNSVVLFSLLLGLDSVAAGTCLGRLMLQPCRRLQLALWFGVCDSLASLIGSTAAAAGLCHGLDWGGWLGPAVLAGYGVYVLHLARRCEGVLTRSPSLGWLAFGLPVGLSLDNLVAGTPATAGGITPIIFGLVSGVMAFCGLTGGASLLARRGASAWQRSGTLMIVVAVGLVLKESFLG